MVLEKWRESVRILLFPFEKHILTLHREYCRKQPQQKGMQDNHHIKPFDLDIQSR